MLEAGLWVTKRKRENIEKWRGQGPGQTLITFIEAHALMRTEGRNRPMRKRCHPNGTDRHIQTGSGWVRLSDVHGGAEGKPTGHYLNTSDGRFCFMWSLNIEVKVGDTPIWRLVIAEGKDALETKWLDTLKEEVDLILWEKIGHGTKSGTRHTSYGRKIMNLACVR